MRAIAARFALSWAPSLCWAADAVQVPVWTSGDATISAQSISASVDGSPSTILGVHVPADDLMLLVVLDLTDDLAAVEQARGALLARVQTMAPNHFVGVLTAQNGLSVLSEPTADREAATAAIKSQQVGGRAGLLETVERAAQIGSSIIDKSGVRLAILYITDSDVNNYREALNNPSINRSDGGDVSRRADSLIREKVARMVVSLSKTQAPVFITHLNYRTDQLNVAYQTGLNAIAGATGGTTIISRSLNEIPSMINNTLDRILGHYSVTVALPKSGKKVDVTLANQTGEDLNYRSSYTFEN